MRTEEIRSEFKFHLLNEEGKVRAVEIAAEFSRLANWLETPHICMHSPELTIAKRKLEEACFYAKKAMAINTANQDRSND